MPPKNKLALTEGDKKRSYTPDPHRLLPQSPDAEKGVLCSCMLAPREVIGLCVEKGIGAEHFSIPAHGTIFSCMVKMWDRNEPVDFMLLTQRLRDEGTLDVSGGAAFVTDLFTLLPTAGNAPYYLEILEEKFLLRSMINVCTEYACRGYDEPEEPLQLLDKAEADIMAIRRLKKTARTNLKAAVIEVMGDLEAAYSGGGKITGLETGFADFDRMTDGLHKENLHIIAARPSHGKTAWLLNVIEHVALEMGKPVGVFSLEMSTKQLVQRLLCSRARINYFRWRDGQATDRDFPALQQAAAQIADAKLFIDDTAGLSIQETRAKARRWRAEHGIELIAGDYLQLFSSTSKRAKDSRQLEVSEVSTTWKWIAKELGIPAVVLAQLDRDVDKKQRRPRLSDLRESGSIEQDADLVAMLWREEMYAENDDERDQLRGLATMAIAKARHGPLGEVPLTYLAEYTRFETRAGAAPPDVDPQLTLPG